MDRATDKESRAQRVDVRESRTGARTGLEEVAWLAQGSPRR